MSQRVGAKRRPMISSA